MGVGLSERFTNSKVFTKFEFGVEPQKVEKLFF